MQLKSILFGFGLGMIVISAVFLVVYRYENWRMGQAYDDVVARATEMGMVWFAYDDDEVIRRALDLGMVFENENDYDEEG